MVETSVIAFAAGRELRGVAAGTAVITAKSAVSDKSGQCSVAVAPDNILDAITDPENTGVGLAGE